MEIRDSFNRVRHVPCGKCIPCRINRSTQWMIRLDFERQQWKDATFLTLTYDDEHIPEDNGLHKEEFQNFMKRLRYYENIKFRYYAVGEYGEREKKYAFPGLPEGKFLHGRPHFHAIIFGLKRDIQSREDVFNAWKKCNKNLIIDPHFNSLGTVTKDSMMYVTDYIQKKQFGNSRQIREYGLNEPPFSLCSKGLGFSAFSNSSNCGDILKNGYLWYNGQKFPIPRYYLDKLDAHPPRRPLPEDNVYRQCAIKQFNLTKEQIEQYDRDWLLYGYNRYFARLQADEKHIEYIERRLREKNNLRGSIL